MVTAGQPARQRADRVKGNPDTGVEQSGAQELAQACVITETAPSSPAPSTCVSRTLPAPSTQMQAPTRVKTEAEIPRPTCTEQRVLRAGVSSIVKLCDPRTASFSVFLGAAFTPPVAKQSDRKRRARSGSPPAEMPKL